jgi:rhamnose transport system permease protein
VINQQELVLSAPKLSVRRRLLQPERAKGLSLLLVMLAATVLFSLVIDDYLSARFVNRMLLAIAITAVLAAGEALVVITRNIDLSIGSILGVAAYITAEQLAEHPSLGSAAAIALAVGIGAALGLINGVLVAFARVPSIVATLGTMSIYRSVLTEHAGGVTVNTGSLPTWMVDLPRSTVLSIGSYEIRTMFAMALLVVVVLYLCLQYTSAGRQLYALGSNPEAAVQVGLNGRRIQLVAFTTCGALAGLAGFLWVGRFGTINVSAGSGLELAAVAAVVVGGVSTLGGSGTVLGAFMGAVLIGQLDQSLVRVPQVSEFWRDAILGILILFAVIIDVGVARRLRERADRDAADQARAAHDG